MTDFSYEALHKQLQFALDCGYSFLRCIDYFESKNDDSKNIIVNRVDVDYSVRKADKLVELFNSLGIKATFFIRLHAPEYNPLDFENYLIIKRLLRHGHELGYHSEIVDQAKIWSEPPEQCLRRDLQIMETAFSTKIRGIASHGGYTGFNNLDFWDEHDPSEFGIAYEAYDKTHAFGLFDRSLYLSDSEWFQWKAYSSGKLLSGDRRNLEEHIGEMPPLIYLLTHADTFFERHFYE